VYLPEHFDESLYKFIWSRLKPDLAIDAVISETEYGGLVTQQWTDCSGIRRNDSRQSPMWNGVAGF